MIRLQRVGRKKNPSYRLVLAEKARDTQGRATEILGTYNPVLKEKSADLKKDRIEYWLSKGAQASSTVNNLLIREGVVSGAKKKSVSISNKRQAKMNEKKAAADDAKKQADDAAKAEAEKPAEETPAEAAPEEAKEENQPPADDPKGQKEEAPAEAEAPATPEASQDEGKKDA